jgi:hypothetical protein
MLTHPLVVALLRTAALGVVVLGLFVLLRRLRGTSRSSERVRTVFGMLVTGVLTLVAFGVASDSGGIVAALAVSGTVIISSVLDSDRGRKS